jgi:hypothetical protein
MPLLGPACCTAVAASGRPPGRGRSGSRRSICLPCSPAPSYPGESGVCAINSLASPSLGANADALFRFKPAWKWYKPFVNSADGRFGSLVSEGRAVAQVVASCAGRVSPARQRQLVNLERAVSSFRDRPPAAAP